MVNKPLIRPYSWGGVARIPLMKPDSFVGWKWNIAKVMDGNFVAWRARVGSGTITPKMTAQVGPVRHQLGP